MFPDQIVAVLQHIIANVSIKEFLAFVKKVNIWGAWDWIFAHPALRKDIDVPIPDAIAATFTPAHVLLIVNALAAKGYFKDLEHHGVSLDWVIGQVPPAKVTDARDAFATAIAEGLASQAEGYWKCTNHRISELTLKASNESVVTMRPFEDRDTGAVWELCGETSDSWGKRGEVCSAFLAELDKAPIVKPATRLKSLGKYRVRELFEPVLADSGNSCLVGIMVCDIVLGSGKRLRAISLSANMVLVKGALIGQTASGQAGQTHMEIFHFRRLEAVLNALAINKDDVPKSVDVAILGYKNGDVVEESGLCKGCVGSMTAMVASRTGMSAKAIEEQVFLIG